MRHSTLGKPRAWLLVPMGVVAVSLLTACTMHADAPTAATHAATHAPTHAPTSAPASAPTRATSSATSQAPSVPEPSGVVATATLVPRSGGTSGTVTVTASDGRFEVVFADFHPSVTGEIDLLLGETSADLCSSLGHASVLGSVPGGWSPTVPLPPVAEGPWWQNPSNFTRLAITRRAAPADNKCAREVLATGQLHWTLPDPRPGLAAVDAGSRPSATGKVTLREGKPVSYLVAPGDQASAIGERFGMTANDVLYLNPEGGLGRSGTGLDAGQVLNLSADLR